MTHENKRKNVRKKQRHSHKLNNQVQVQHHYSSTCGGKKSTATSLENAKARGLTPCKKCAQQFIFLLNCNIDFMKMKQKRLTNNVNGVIIILQKQQKNLMIF